MEPPRTIEVSFMRIGRTSGHGNTRRCSRHETSGREDGVVGDESTARKQRRRCFGRGTLAVGRGGAKQQNGREPHPHALKALCRMHVSSRKSCCLTGYTNPASRESTEGEARFSIEEEKVGEKLGERDTVRQCCLPST